MAVKRVTKASVFPRAERVRIQGKEWLPGPQSIIAHCQGADLTPEGPAPTLSFSSSSAGKGWHPRGQGGAGASRSGQHSQTAPLDEEDWLPAGPRAGAFVQHLSEPPLASL